MRPTMRSVALAAVALLLTPLLVSPASAATVTVSEKTTLPAGGSFTLAGRGFGHGIGMSQYGAMGAARAGLSAAQILAFYYPGTAAATQANTDLRVLVSGDNDDDTIVTYESGMTAVDATNAAVPLTFTGGTPTQLKVTQGASGLVLAGLVGSAWVPSTATISGTTLTFAATDSTVQVVLPSGAKTEYRGKVRAVEDGAAPGMITVNVVPMESYLQAVVPAEAYSDWPAAALQAQAVAARTYATYERAANTARSYDICDTAACQMYPGYRKTSTTGTVTTSEASTTTSAVTATPNQIRTYGGTPAFTQFSASNGGWTTAGQFAYLVAKADPYDGASPLWSNPHTWSLKVTVAKLAAAYAAVGTPTSIGVVHRNGNGEWGGRVVDVTISGTAGSTTVTGSAFASKLGLKSDWFKVTGSTRLDGDLSLDGRPDLFAVMSNGSARVYNGTGTGTFGAARTITGNWSVYRIVVRGNDLDGDGRGDVLAIDSSQRLWRYPSDGAGALGKAVQIGAGWGKFTKVAAPGDMTGDGNADIVAIDTSGNLVRYNGTGAGTVSGATVIGRGWASMTALVGAGDWDGDGRADLIARTSDGRLILYRNLASGLRAQQIGAGWGSMKLISASSDWNGDGKPDLIVANATGSLVDYPWNGTKFAATRAIGAGWASVRSLS